MTAQCTFPTEIIYKILSYADPRDIVRWRAVSTWYRTITCDPVLWKALYANSSFPRPSGPFPSQSIKSLERTLITAAQLAQSWTTRPMRDTSNVRLQLEGVPSLICGRWIVVCELNRRFVLLDCEATDQRHARQVLWEAEELVSCWDVCSVASTERQCVAYVLLRLCHTQENLPNWKLLEFQLDDESGKLSQFAIIDPPASIRLRKVEVSSGKSKFLCILVDYMNCVVFDTRTHVFYKLPEFHVALDETRKRTQSRFPRERQITFTDTHLVSLCCHQGPLGQGPVVVQVFPLPSGGSPAENGIHVLQFTHEGILDDCLANIMSLQPLVDPASGATIVRLLDYCTRRYNLQVTRIDLTLPKPTGVDILPITVNVQYIDLLKDGAPTNRYRACFQYVDVSDNGHVRGFFRGVPRKVALGPQEDDHIMKFTIDATQEKWVVARGELSPAVWSRVDGAWIGINTHIAFDGMRGRLCFVDCNNRRMINFVNIE